MLPDGLFLNLLDINLQTEIAKSTDYNFDVANILKSLLEEGPSILKQDLSDWSVEEFDGANVMFYRGKNYIPKNEELRRKILALHHDHLESWKHLTQFQKDSGGQALGLT